MIRIKKRIITHFILWSLLFVFFFAVGAYFRPTVDALVSAIFNTSTIFIIYLLTQKFLFPTYYHNSKKFLVVSFIFLLLLTGIMFFIDYLLYEYFYTIENKKKIPLIFPLLRLFIGNLLAYFINTSFCLFDHSKKLQANEKHLIEEKLNTELKLLKAQINPHFIFNALNNIYSLTYMKRDLAPDSILKLSEMLRYVFYECNKDKVNIYDEINYINNYIAFQQMKTDTQQNIFLESELQSAKIEIAPMLFIPFIENAFKYSRIEDLSSAFVNINLKEENQILEFSMENNLPSERMPASGSKMGIQNVRHRLDIIYPNNYSLDIENDEFAFRVHLKIKLN